MPPLIFSEDEAVALTLGLLIAQRSGLTDEIQLPAVLAKIERVLPESTRLRVDAVATAAEVEPASEKPAPLLQIVSALAAAATNRRRTRIVYQPVSGDSTEREFDCYGVGFNDGAWYAIGFCHLRQSQRLFRLDRMAVVTPLDVSFTPPSGIQPRDAISMALASVPRRWAVSVLMLAPVDEVRSRVPLSHGHFTACGDGSTRIQVEVDDLRWMARTLAGAGLRFVVEGPPELPDAIRAYALELVTNLES